MTDEEILALYRQKRTNPYLTLSTAKALHGLELKFGYLRAEPEPSREPGPSGTCSDHTAATSTSIPYWP
jgi:hypothetical protein